MNLPESMRPESNAARRREVARSVDEMRVLPVRRLTADAEPFSNELPGERLVGAQLLVAAVQRVGLDAVDVNGVGSALSDCLFDQPIQVVTGGGELPEAFERVSRPSQFVYHGSIRHRQHMMTDGAGFVN